MKPLSLWTLALVAALSGALGALISAMLMQSGQSLLVVTPWLSVLFVVVAIWILVLGIGVRRLRRKERTWVSSVGAGRTALFARSSAPVLAGLAGFLLGVAAVGFGRWWAPAVLYSAWFALAAGLTGTLACICAVMVERWCIDDSEDGKDGSSSDGGSPPSRSHHPRPHHTSQIH